MVRSEDEEGEGLGGGLAMALGILMQGSNDQGEWLRVVWCSVAKVKEWNNMEWKKVGVVRDWSVVDKAQPPYSGMCAKWLPRCVQCSASKGREELVGCTPSYNMRSCVGHSVDAQHTHVPQLCQGYQLVFQKPD